MKYSKQFKVTDLQILTSTFLLADVPFDKNKPFMFKVFAVQAADLYFFSSYYYTSNDHYCATANAEVDVLRLTCLFSQTSKL